MKEKTPSNSKTAFKELTSFLKTEKPEQAKESDNLSANVMNEVKKMVTEGANEKAKATSAQPIKKTVSTISADTEITGNITTKGDIIVEGVINGCVKAAGHITVVGTIIGNIDADCLSIEKGKIVAETINLAKNINISLSSEISGNINCKNAFIDSTVKGNVFAADKCEVRKNANIMGDIQAKELCMENGSRLVGKVETLRS